MSNSNTSENQSYIYKVQIIFTWEDLINKLKISPHGVILIYVSFMYLNFTKAWDA